MELTDTDFSNLRTYIRKVCGLHMLDDKKYLVRQRLEPLAIDLGCKTFTQLYMRLMDDQSEEMQNKVTLAMTTNETSFFRDRHPFETFQTHLLPEMVEAFVRQRKDGLLRPDTKFSLYSVACSSGQEPYTIAICVHEYVRTVQYLLGIRPEDFSILCTDINQDMLDYAKAGRYNALDVGRGLPEPMRQRYFTHDGTDWIVKPELRNLCTYLRLNLLDGLTHLGRFHMIFCRNVLIYFDEATKRAIVAELQRMLLPGGYLMLGSSENLYGMTDGFERVRIADSVLYQRPKA